MTEGKNSYKPFDFFFKLPDPVFKFGDLMMNEIAHSTELTHCLLARQLLDVYRGEITDSHSIELVYNSTTVDLSVLTVR